MRWWIAIAGLSAACSNSEEQPPAGSAGAAGWTAKTLVEARVLVPEQGGCLVPTGEVLPAGETLAVIAADERHVLLGGDRFVAAADVTLGEMPADLAIERPSVAQIPTDELRYDDAGCPVPTGSTIDEHGEADALARFHDSNYRGHVVIDRSLRLAAVRAIDAAGWTYPWHTAVQIIKQVPEGFVVGAGVMIAPRVILTVEHLKADETYCYSREPNSGVAWDAGHFECDNIAGPAEPHPAVDAAIVRLKNDEPPPYASVPAVGLAVDEPFYALSMHTFHTHVMNDVVAAWVGWDNANCAAWPDKSSVTINELVLSGGDSGGPAFRGDDLVGIAHGGKCKASTQPDQHVFVHVPGIRDWLAPELP